MGYVKLTFNRNAFADYVFQPYNAAVKRGEYNKIEYNLWRKIRDWLYDDEWLDYEVRILNEWNGYSIYLWHELKIAPERIFLSFDYKGFGNYISDKWNDIQYYSNEFMSEIKEALNTNASNQLCYSDNMTISSSTCNDYYTVDVKSAYVNVDNMNLTTFIDKVVQDNIAKITVKEEKENNEMNFANFDFGPVDSSVHMSMYGMAIKNASGTYVSYDTENKQIMDVEILNFEGANKFMYKMPVALSDIAVGDVIVHCRKPMFVVAVRKDGKLACVDPYAGEEKVIMLARSPFGFNFATKVVSFLNFGAADVSNPFGNMLPFFLMGDNKNADDLLPMMLMMNGQSAMTSNPMLMYALFSKDNKMKDMLPFLLMMPQAAPAHTCCCGGNCHEAEDCDKEG